MEHTNDPTPANVKLNKNINDFSLWENILKINNKRKVNKFSVVTTP